MKEWDEAVRALWAALSEVEPFDRGVILGIFIVGLAVGIHEGLGLLAPFYALLLVSLGVAMFWALRELARTKL